MSFKARKSDLQIIDQVTSFPFAAICRRKKTDAFNVFGLCKVSCFGHLAQAFGIHLPKSALFKGEGKSGPAWLANQWIRTTVFRPQAKPLWTFEDTSTSTLRSHSMWLLSNNKTGKSYVGIHGGLTGSVYLDWARNVRTTADRNSPFQNQTSLNLSAATAGSNDLILSDRIKAHSGLCSAKAADHLMGAKASGNAERKSWSNLDQIITMPSRQNDLYRQSWFKIVTRSPAFVISSAAINGLLFVTPLASLAQTTTIYGTGGSSNTYSGGTINFGDTVILNDGASVAGDIIDNGTLQFNQTTDLTITNLITGNGTLSQTNTGNLTLAYNTTVSAVANTNAFDLGISLANGSLLIGANGGNNLVIGSVSNGALTINGGTVKDSFGYLGFDSGSNGTATVSAGGTWTNTNELVIGNGGNGSLTVAGGNVSASSSVIGYDSGGNGTATISSGNWFNTGELQVGRSGNGTLTLSGGNITNANGTIGNQSGSIGYVAVSGGNWTNTGNLTVGVAGTANLTISGGVVKVIGNLDKGANGSINLNDGGTLSIGNLSLANFTYGGVLTFNSSANVATTSNLSGTGSLVKQGNNTLTLSGNNTYTGGTTLSAGTLVLNSSNAIGTSGAITFSGGTLQQTSLDTTDYSARFSTAANQAYAINTNNQTITWANNLTSSGGTLSKSGGGTLIITGNNTYTGNTTIVGNGGTLQVGAGGTSGSISTSGNISTGTNTNIWFNRSDAISYGGVISGLGGLFQKGAGTLTLSGANTYIGDTRIEAGTLLVTGSLSDSSNVAVSSGATYQLGADNTIRMLEGAGAVNLASYNLTAGTTARSSSIFSGVIAGTGALTFRGPGTLTLTGNNTYTGNTTISAGTLRIGANGTTGSLAGNITNNANLSFNRTDAITYGGEMSGSGNLSQAGTGTLTLTGNNTYTGNTTISSGTLQIGAGGTTGSLGSNIANNANLSFNRSDAISYGGVISGSGTLFQNGTGTLTLTGANNYTGNTTINAGVLSLASGLAIGSAGVISFSGGSLQFTANNTNDYSARFNQASNQSYAIDTNGQNISLASNLTSVGGTLTKAGLGTLSLLGNNTYTGGTTLAGGTLSLGSNGALGTIGTISFSGGSLQFTANNTTDYSERFSQASNQAFAIDTNGQDVSLLTALTSVGGSLTKHGAGTLVLTGNNTYTGNTSIQAGTLVVSENSSLADSSDVSVATGATYQVDETDTIGSIAGNGTINLNQRNLTAGGSNSTTTFSGVMLGEGSFTKAGTGTLTLSGNNTYTGGTTLAGGTLSLGSNQALGTEGTLRFSGGSLQFTANNTTDYSARFNQASNQGYAIDTNGQNISLATGLTSAGGSLTKQGTGSLTLTGNNTYTGSTTVNAGTLQIGNGSGSASISQSSIGYLGFDSGSNGTASVSTGGAWTTTGDLFIGYAGNGNLTVSGGTVSNVNGVIGAIAANGQPNDPDYIAGSNGTVTISGGNWTNTGNLTVGDGGNGTLIVNGGNVSNVNGVIGYNSSATISGGNWTNSGNLYIGTNNSTLTITGGLVTVAGTLTKTPTGTINLNAGGSLSIGAGGTTTGSLQSSGFDYAGTLIFNRSVSDYTFDGILGGSGSLVKEGSNVLTLRGNSTYTGTTAINAGTLQIGNGSDSASISSSPIINNASLVFKNNANKTHAAQISGSGILEKRGGGTLTLSGNNTFTGNTTIYAGTLQIGAGGTSGSLVSNVSGGPLVFNRSDSSVYGGVFSGSTLTKLGAGTLTLTGNNTHTGTTTISAGTLQIGAGGTSGAISHSPSIANHANLTFNRSDATSYAGAISGSGNVTQLGAGTLTLTGNHSYTGSSTVGGTGTLRVQGSIAPSSGLTVNSGATLAGNGTITGTTIQAGGILAPNNSGSSPLAITGGSGNLTLASGSISNFSIVSGNSDRVTASGSINLDGVLNLAFSADNYLTSAPYTLFSGQSRSGTFSNVAVSGLSSSYQYALDYTGTSLNLLLTINIEPGQSSDITNSSSPTTMSGGTLVINQSGSYNTSLVLATPASAANTNSIDGNGLNAVLSGPITGTGPITFVNSQNSTTISNTVLSGNNTYTGSTTIDTGATLSVNGSIASSSGLTVNAGGTIGGNGALPGTTINPGGTLAPGNSIGQLTVASLSFGPVAPGGILDVEIQGPQNDKTTVTGNVTNFTGTANLIAYGGGNPWPSFDYQLITAANNFATSTSLTLNPVGITSALLLNGTTLVQEADGNGQTFDVMWRPSNGSGATASAMQAIGHANPNQLASAGVFDSIFRRLAVAAANASGLTTGLNATGTAIGSTGFTTGQAAAAGITPDFLTLTSQLLGITSSSQLTAAISTLGPESYAAFQSVGLETLQRQRQQLLVSAGQCASHGWVINAPTSKNGKAPKNPICLYGQAGNANSNIHGQDGLSSYNSSLFSSFYGLELKANPFWTLGAAYGYGTSNLNGLGPTNASVTATVNSASLYGVYTPTTSSPWTFKGLLGYGNYALNGSRQVAVIGAGTPINGSTTANGLTAALTAQVIIPLTKPSAPVPVLLKPLIGLAYGNFQQAGFSESGGGPLNLNVDGNSASSLVGTFGLELTSGPIPLNNDKTISLVPKLALAYQVDALAGDAANSSLLASSPASGAESFLTQGQNRGFNSFSIAAGADLALSKSTVLFANVNLEAFSSGSQFGYGGGIRVNF